MTTLPIPEDTKLRQRTASDPRISAWVSANAGSGKTYVLSRRVIRLLLSGNDPSSILCLTFTKAAANEMANRVFAELARWTVLPDSELTKVLSDLGEKASGAKQLVYARQLFARALETPGGLKVQTIHAFCERLLQQFPFEANVPGHFEVADDEKQAELLLSARGSVFQQAVDEPDGLLGKAFTALVDASDDESIDDAVGELLRKRDVFIRHITSGGNGIDGHIVQLQHALKLLSDDNLEGLKQDVTSGSIGGFGLDDLTEFAFACQQSGAKSDVAVAERIATFVNASGPDSVVSAWLAIFATAAGDPRKPARFVTKALKEAQPLLFDRIERVLEDGFFNVSSKLNALRTVANTTALFTLTDAIIATYLRAKNNRGLLDYDDLISKTERLLSRSESALWVQYKLDRGLSHILVDEAQDTSPAQWRVVDALSEAFFHDADPDARAGQQAARTLFAVGDEKQSIYSFQGAAPDAFDHQRRRFERQARQALLPWENITLNLSFRSANDVLSAVDKVFSSPEMANSVSKMGVDPHQAYRTNAPGEVRLWPLIVESEAETSDDWRLPVDRPAGALEQLANHIASDIAAAIHTSSPLADGRPMRAGDFLILLKKRGQMMGLVNKALKKAGVPVAGADRLALTDHIAIKDLLCLGEVMLLPENDLAVATLLKSPFFDFSDDDLIALAAERSGSMMNALRNSQRSKDRLAFERLSSWLNRVDFETPYVFFGRLLSVDKGRKNLLKRFGTEAEDIIDEFLAQALEYETAPGSGAGMGLQGFIAWLGERTSAIKREMDSARDEVRVMTVHGAKGLEAPIVYLVDDGSQPRANIHRPRILTHWPNGADGAPVLFWGAGAKKDQTNLQRDLLEASDKDALAEYRRLLYVGMTRAEDQLIICGKEGKRPMSDDNWYKLVEQALKPDMQEVSDAAGTTSHFLWQVTERKTAEAFTKKPDPAVQTGLPQWTKNPPLPGPPRAKPISPSRLDGDDQRFEEISWQERIDTLGQRDSAFALVRGQAIHTLLQYLPNLNPEARNSSAEAYLKQALPASSPVSAMSDIIQKTFDILNNRSLQFLFASSTRAEVSVAGELNDDRGTLAVSGKIDRLCETDDGLLIVDFKTNRKVPATSADIPVNYVNQLAAYRALLRQSFVSTHIDAAVLWVENGRLDMLDLAMLDAAEAKILSKDLS
ncbi:MAG: double-strand break repair helicase AddA [Hyphomicrobiales bacterium]